MKLKKGQVVDVRDAYGSVHRKTIWEVVSNSALITSERNFKRLLLGHSNIPPVKVSIESIREIPKSDLNLAAS